MKSIFFENKTIKFKNRTVGYKNLSNNNSIFKRTLARYSVFMVIFMILGLFSFGEIPHTIVYENPNREVTTTDTIKRHKEKAELNITVTKIKSQVIKAELDNKAKKIYFNLNRDSVKRSDFDFKLETTDRVFVSEKLEEVPSISTTNGRKKINGLKRKNRSLDTGTIQDGNLTWTVKDLRSVEGGKSVMVEYKTLPSEIYVGVTDKDYNIKKIFYGNFSSTAPYIITELDGYVSVYNEDVRVNTKYDYDVSDVVMWTRDNTAVDVKFAEITMKPINDVTLMNKKPYIAVESENVTIQKGREVYQGRLHLINTSYSSSVPMTLKNTRADSLVSKIEAEPNILGTGTNLLTAVAYIRFKAEDYKKMTEGEFTVNKGIISGTTEGTSKPIILPKMNVTHTTSANGKNIDLDFWFFGTDFSNKVNLVINPRNNGTGNLEERALDEKTGVTETTMLTGTDSVFDMTGRGVKYDFYDTDTVEIEGVQGVTPNEQNKGSFENYKNRWASATIPGYKVKARIWSDYDGIELDFERLGALSEANDGVRKFKVVHKNGNGQVVQTWNINLYVNNINYSQRHNYIPFFRTAVDLFGYTDQNYYDFFTDRDKNGNRVKNGDTGEIFGSYRNDPQYLQIQITGKENDFKLYFPIYTSGISFYSNYTGKNVILSSNEQYINDFSESIGTWNGDFFVGKIDNNGLCTIKLRQYIQKPIDLVSKVEGEYVYVYNNKTSLYTTYGNNKRKIWNSFNIFVRPLSGGNHEIWKNEININGIPLILNLVTGGNYYLSDTVYKSNKGSSEATFENNGWIKGIFDNNLWGEIILKIDEMVFLDNVKVNSNLFQEEINKIYTKDEICLIGSQLSKYPYLKYGLGIRKWYMSKNSKKVTVYTKEGNDITGNTNESYERYSYITLNSFDPLFMFDKTKSSMGEILVVIKDIDMTPDYVPPKQIVDLAEVTFKYLNIEALRQNTNLMPKFVLPDEVYLNFKDGTGTIDDRIKAKLSFSNEIDNMTAVEMADKGGDYAGGNNTRVYLHIEPNEYKKMLLNGHGKQYQVFGSFVNNKHGVPDERDTTDVVKIGVVATTDPDGGSRYEPFFATVLNSLNVISRAVIPIPYTVKFKETEPLITNELQLINNSIKYVDMPAGYNYNNNVSLTGTVKPYDYFIKAHRYEITDTTGKTISDTVGSSGSGAYWEGLALGKNKVTIHHKRDFGTTDGHQTRELTFMKLDEWNFEEYTGHIIEKHFLPHSDYVNQYYDIGINVPALNPHIYYDNTGDNLRLDEEINIKRTTKKYLYDLGNIATKNYDTTITKHMTGDLKDELGIRVVPGDSLTIKERGTGKAFPEKAKIVFVEKIGDTFTELPYDKLNPDKMIGGNQKARIALKLPQSLDVSKDYIIEGAGAGILDKNNNLPSKEYILAIGRNKYFKECIPRINLNAERLVGDFTLRFDNNYSIRELQGFNSTTLDKREPISLLAPILNGVTLEDVQGSGMLELEDGDILEVQDVNRKEILKVNVGANGTSDKKELLLSDSMTKLALQAKNGKVYLGLNMWKMGTTNNLILKVFRGTGELMNQRMLLKTPNTQFIITQMGELDFGSVIAGSKNRYAETDFEMQSTEDVKEITFELSTEAPILENFQTKKTLQARNVKVVIMKGTGDREYKLKLNGYLDVPKDTQQGNYTGSMTLKLKIK